MTNFTPYGITRHCETLCSAATNGGVATLAGRCVCGRRFPARACWFGCTDAVCRPQRKNGGQKIHDVSADSQRRRRSRLFLPRPHATAPDGQPTVFPVVVPTIGEIRPARCRQRNPAHGGAGENRETNAITHHPPPITHHPHRHLPRGTFRARDGAGTGG